MAINLFALRDVLSIHELYICVNNGQVVWFGLVGRKGFYICAENMMFTGKVVLSGAYGGIWYIVT